MATLPCDDLCTESIDVLVALEYADSILEMDDTRFSFLGVDAPFPRAEKSGTAAVADAAAGCWPTAFLGMAFIFLGVVGSSFCGGGSAGNGGVSFARLTRAPTLLFRGGKAAVDDGSCGNDGSLRGILKRLDFGDGDGVLCIFKTFSIAGGGAGRALEKRERPVLGVWSEVVSIREGSSEVDRHERGEVGCVVGPLDFHAAPVMSSRQGKKMRCTVPL